MDERRNEPDDGKSALKFCVFNGGYCCRSLSGKATLIPVRLEETSVLFNGGLTEARTALQNFRRRSNLYSYFILQSHKLGQESK